MNDDLINSIPGAAAFADWYGQFPHFHDADASLELDQEGNCTITLTGARMTSHVTADGFIVLDKHYEATLRIKQATSVALSGFMPGGIILQALQIDRVPDGYRVEIDGSTYGLSGTISARTLQFEFRPTEPAAGSKGKSYG